MYSSMPRISNEMWFSEWLGAWEMAKMWCWGPDRMKHMKSPSQSDNRNPRTSS